MPFISVSWKSMSPRNSLTDSDNRLSGRTASMAMTAIEARAPITVSATVVGSFR